MESVVRLSDVQCRSWSRAGLVYRVSGRGTFPAGSDGRYLRQFGSIEDLMALSVDTELEYETNLACIVNIEAAGRLRLDSDAVLSVSFRRFHGGVPFCHTTIYLRPSSLSLLVDVVDNIKPGQRSTNTFIGLLDGRIVGRIDEAEQSITAEPMPAAIAQALDSTSGEPSLRIDRVYFSSDSEPVELAISYFVPSRYSYRVRLRRK